MRTFRVNLSGSWEESLVVSARTEEDAYDTATRILENEGLENWEIKTFDWEIEDGYDN